MFEHWCDTSTHPSPDTNKCVSLSAFGKESFYVSTQWIGNSAQYVPSDSSTLACILHVLSISSTFAWVLPSGALPGKAPPSLWPQALHAAQQLQPLSAGPKWHRQNFLAASDDLCTKNLIENYTASGPSRYDANTCITPLCQKGQQGVRRFE